MKEGLFSGSLLTCGLPGLLGLLFSQRSFWERMILAITGGQRGEIGGWLHRGRESVPLPEPLNRLYVASGFLHSSSQVSWVMLPLVPSFQTALKLLRVITAQTGKPGSWRWAEQVLGAWRWAEQVLGAWRWAEQVLSNHKGTQNEKPLSTELENF